MNGFIIGISQTFEYLKKMQERINDFIVRTSNIDKAQLENLLRQQGDLLNDVGTILIGNQAVECGLINEVGGLKEAISKLNALIDENE